MRVFIRADGGADLGLGHVVRCAALAEGLRARGARVVFVTRATEPAVLGKIEEAGCAVERVPASGTHDARVVIEHVGRAPGALVVVDVYGIGVEYQAAIRAAGARLLVIDDLAEGRFVADVVLNQNLGARPEAYAAAPHTRLLLGPRYALLRRAFRSVPGPRRPAAPPRVLVTMGGADPGNATTGAVAAVDRVPGEFALDVVVGASFAHRSALEAVTRAAAHAAEVHHDPGDLPALMGRATLAVSAAGGTCWELAHLGVPAVLLVLAPNQAPVAAGLERAGFAAPVGTADPFPSSGLAAAVAALLGVPARRRRMAAVGRGLVDGRGVERVVAELVAA